MADDWVTALKQQAEAAPIEAEIIAEIAEVAKSCSINEHSTSMLYDAIFDGDPPKMAADLFSETDDIVVVELDPKKIAVAGINLENIEAYVGDMFDRLGFYINNTLKHKHCENSAIGYADDDKPIPYLIMSYKGAEQKAEALELYSQIHPAIEQQAGQAR